MALTKLSFLLLVLLPNVALAQDKVATQSWWQYLLANVIQIAVVILTPTAILLAHKLVSVVAKKTGVEVSERHNALVDEWVNKGIHYAEEQGRKALKADKPLSNDDKKAAAAKFAMDGLNSLGLPNAGRDALEALAESKLHMQRAEKEPK